MSSLFNFTHLLIFISFAAVHGATNPGPVCTPSASVCCSNSAPTLHANEASMPSRWYSNMLAHGAKIQIREVTWNTWWSPGTSSTWANQQVSCKSSTIPSAAQVLTVVRISNTQIQLRTPDGWYVCASATIVGSNSLPTMATCVSKYDKRTYLTPQVVPTRTKTAVYFKCYDGLYISSSGALLQRWSTSASTWEEHDIMEVMNVASMRGPNIGSWLMNENWMLPSFYPNPVKWNTGTLVQIQGVKTKMWVSAAAAASSSQKVFCSAAANNILRAFSLDRATPSGGAFRFKTATYKFWSVLNGGGKYIVSDAADIGTKGNEAFTIVFQSETIDTARGNLAIIKAPNGKYIQATAGGEVTTNGPTFLSTTPTATTWTSAFAFRIFHISSVDGEWQFSYENGPNNVAKNKLTAHHNTFFNSTHWEALARDGVNAVRIPIGWWIMTEPTGGLYPYIPQYMQYLDAAFAASVKYGIRIWISIHGSPGSQSGWSNTGCKSGLVEFPRPYYYDLSLKLLTWLCKRYLGYSTFLGIGLMNEPKYTVRITTLQDWYVDAYNLIRSYSPCLYISMQSRIGSNIFDVYWLMNDNLHTNLILEVHVYDLFGSVSVKTAAEEIAYVKTQRLKEIASMQAVAPRTVLIGEFCNAMATSPTPSEQLAWSLAQMQTFATAVNGWFFWSLNLETDGYDNWKWFKSRQNGLLPKNPATNRWY
eukprot:TRINITY_DN9213_c0_g2_i1.p1 TRINITY_DN9213_c0_g2~~TRINITY_DN9213_c0_g2_i1.p1  ORF type:complete len:704 (-),score=48.07 TRINITY_DN9213_c0_g2_i1:998-3109(-)